MSAKNVDEILEQIGQMGRYQISRLAMFCFIMIPQSFHLLNMFFIGAEAPWQCVKNSTVCKLNGSFVAGDDDYDFRCKINRSDWEYASYDGPEDSIISEFDLVCDDAFFGWLAKSMMFFSTILCTIPLGIISDRHGRKFTLYPCILFLIIVGLASAFVTEYWQFLISRFFIGAAFFTVNISIGILSAEFVGPRYRPLSQSVMWIALHVGALILALTAYFVRTWRNLMILSTGPWIFLLIFWKFTPESIRWYITHDKVEKAESSLREIAKVNKKEYPKDVALKVPEISTDVENLGFLALFSTKTLAISTLTQAFALFVVGVVFFGTTYGASDLGGNFYLAFALSNFVGIISIFLTVDNCERFGRKKTLITHMLLSGVSCFIVAFIPAGTDRIGFIVGRVLVGSLAKCFIVVCLTSMWIWSCELLPTSVRTRGMAFLDVITNIGSFTAPFVVELKRIHPTLPFGLMGALAVIAALLCLILPETKGMPTAEVYESSNGSCRDIGLKEKDARAEVTHAYVINT